MTKTKTKKAKALKPCVVKEHFECDGTGHMCVVCGESESACGCEDPEIETCKGCEGGGRICVEHDAPCGDMTYPPRCDAAKKASAK